MKKIATICLMLIILLQAQAKDDWEEGNGDVITITRQIASFDKLSVDGFFDVELFYGKERTITIQGESNLLKFIVTEVRGNILRIKVKNNKSIRTTKKIKITVPFQNIEELLLSGSGKVWTNDVIETEDFRASVTGSGDFKLNLNVDSVDVSISGSGDIMLAGTSQDITANVTGSGEVNAKKLITENAILNIAGSGDIIVHCNNRIKAKVIGSGDVEYYGKPDKRDVTVIGSGDISSH